MLVIVFSLVYDDENTLMTTIFYLLISDYLLFVFWIIGTGLIVQMAQSVPNNSWKQEECIVVLTFSVIAVLCSFFTWVYLLEVGSLNSC